ncbi:hypothetical protein MKW92_003340, partial [Papaver armeniacum]
IRSDQTFLQQRGQIIDLAGGYVIHLSSSVAWFTTAHLVGLWLPHARQHLPPASYTGEYRYLSKM